VTEEVVKEKLQDTDRGWHRNNQYLDYSSWNFSLKN
jgi:hypothetical protein